MEKKEKDVVKCMKQEKKKEQQARGGFGIYFYEVREHRGTTQGVSTAGSDVDKGQQGHVSGWCPHSG